MLSVFAVEKYDNTFSFNFNGNAGTVYDRNTKTDSLDPAPAYVNITFAEFGGNSVMMWIERPNGIDLTPDYTGIHSTGVRYFTYLDGVFDSGERQTDLDLSCRSYGIVQGLGGTWLP